MSHSDKESPSGAPGSLCWEEQRVARLCLDTKQSHMLCSKVTYASKDTRILIVVLQAINDLKMVSADKARTIIIMDPQQTSASGIEVHLPTVFVNLSMGDHGSYIAQWHRSNDYPGQHAFNVLPSVMMGGLIGSK